MKIKLLALLLGPLVLLNTIFAQTIFTDDAAIDSWGQTAITELVRIGLIEGNEDGSLRPGAPINRAEFLKTLVLATEVELVLDTDLLFPDVLATDWFTPYVSTAVNLGWAKGYPDGYFRPGDPINRAEAAKLFVQTFGLEYQNQTNDQYWFDGYARALSDREMLPYQTSIAKFNPATEPTRLEIFEQLYRILRGQGLFSLGDAPGVDTRRELSALPSGQSQPAPASGDETYLTFTPTKTNTDVTFNVSSTTAGKNLEAPAGQKNVTLVGLKIQSDGNAKLHGLQVRRIGNGAADDFDQIWLEYDGQILSQKVPPQTDFVYLQLLNPLTIVGQKTIQVKGDLSAGAQSGSSSRWVIFLPEWIDSTAQSKIGFFPLGGQDINVR